MLHGEMEQLQFKDPEHHGGYFCYNYIYIFLKPSHYPIVMDEGSDV